MNCVGNARASEVEADVELGDGGRGRWLRTMVEMVERMNC